jgi:glycosyltransferase involved in cell wall biosynthesis
MNILLLAPHPFYKERGTPIAVDLLLRVFSEMGHKVDVVTYHEGINVKYDNIQLYRIPKIPGIHNITPGFSWKKIICDFFMVFIILKLIKDNKYHLIHAVEEAVFLGLFIKFFFHIPYIYDMDSSLSQQIIDGKPFLRIFSKVFHFCERLAVKRAIAILPVCDALNRAIQKHNPRRAVVLHDVSLLENGEVRNGEDLRSTLSIAGLLVLYVGNLESYQGIDLLLESFALVLKRTTAADLVIIGGECKDIKKYEQRARILAIAHKVHFLGPKPIQHLWGYLSQADILVSPRLQGENTPMKLYSYLHSGIAVLATRLPTHTQVLNSHVAMLADATPEAFSESMLYLMSDQQLRSDLGNAGRKLIENCYSYTSFRHKVFNFFDSLEEDIEFSTKNKTAVSK